MNDLINPRQDLATRVFSLLTLYLASLGISVEGPPDNALQSKIIVGTSSLLTWGLWYTRTATPLTGLWLMGLNAGINLTRHVRFSPMYTGLGIGLVIVALWLGRLPAPLSSALALLVAVTELSLLVEFDYLRKNFLKQYVVVAIYIFISFFIFFVLPSSITNMNATQALTDLWGEASGPTKEALLSLAIYTAELVCLPLLLVVLVCYYMVYQEHPSLFYGAFLMVPVFFVSFSLTSYYLNKALSPGDSPQSSAGWLDFLDSMTVDDLARVGQLIFLTASSFLLFSVFHRDARFGGSRKASALFFLTCFALITWPWRLIHPDMKSSLAYPTYSLVVKVVVIMTTSKCKLAGEPHDWSAYFWRVLQSFMIVDRQRSFIVLF